MGWLKIQPKDSIPFVLAGLLGFLAGRLVPDHTWSVYTSVMVSYHLFLVWLVFSSEKETGISLGILSTLVTHVACVFLAIAVTMARHYIPFFSILQFGLSSIAVFERGWLFSGAKPRPRLQIEQPNPSPAAPPSKAKDPWRQSGIAAATGQDHEEWLRYLATRNPTHRKAGCSMSQEYEEWLRARVKRRAAAEAAAGQPAMR